MCGGITVPFFIFSRRIDPRETGPVKTVQLAPGKVVPGHPPIETPGFEKNVQPGLLDIFINNTTAF